ncbi:dipeptidase [Novosphingobium sp.]|uniref:dipeptidase n=1 Tax=Novosphingobium sp. TaxID=1874826 RepID=UPI0035B40EC8
MRRALLISTALCLAFAAPVHAKPAPTPEQVAAAALKAAPVFDGHNDVPEQLRDRRKDVLEGFDFTDTTGTADPAAGLGPMQTDLKRLRQGHVGAQFWSVYVSANLPEPQAVVATLEQIDVTKRLIAKYPADMVLCTTADCAVKAMKQGKIASFLGMEGGHSIAGSLGVLRQMYELGARYMTITHFKNISWADSATDAPKNDGLTPFGVQVIKEMQRLGMLVDLSHTSEATMLDALDVAHAPVIFSHSGALGINGSPRNVSDAVLDRLKTNGGIVMIDAYPSYVNERVRQWNAARSAEEARLKSLNPGNPAAAKAALADWEKANPMPRTSVADVADHVDYVVKRVGIDHVGLGGDFDGIETTVDGMSDVSGYPALFVELARRGYSQQDLEKLASGNILRVLRECEAYAAAHRADPPQESPVAF